MCLVAWPWASGEDVRQVPSQSSHEPSAFQSMTESAFLIPWFLWAVSVFTLLHTASYRSTICSKGLQLKAPLFLSLFLYLSTPQRSWSGPSVHQGDIIALSSPSRVSTEASCAQDLCLSPATSPGPGLNYVVDTHLTSPVTYQCCPGFLAWPWTFLVTWDFVGEAIAPASTLATLSSCLPSLAELPALAAPW